MLKTLLPVTLLVCSLVACDAKSTSNENQTKNQNAAPRSKTQEEREKDEKERAAGIKTLDDAVSNSLVMEVQTVPLIGGGAYIITAYGVWYLNGANAVRVKDVQVASRASLIVPGTALEKHLWLSWRGEVARRERSERNAKELQGKIEELESEDK